MSAVRFNTTSQKPFADFQRDLDHAIRGSRAGEMIRHSWSDHTMRIQGPGAQGVLHYATDGVVRAEVHIGFPATLMKHTIVSDIRAMLEAAAGCRVAVAE